MILRVLGDVLRCRDLRRVLLAFVCFNAASMAGLAIGSIAASAFVALAGGRGAFVCLAATLPVAALLVVRPVLAADSAVLPVVEIARLRASRIFSALGAPALEGLARAVAPVQFAGRDRRRPRTRAGRSFLLGGGRRPRRERRR
jgi:hypothetical protein